ncbi:putative proline-rich protein 21 [Hyalella azteca]|uniref:Proline-rich protein 21 n=1 Tax=Hyalella azteca TaxID=294128 RepID=A0A8B7PMX7_HYAAZ|nr:putative proline-rich protein 21 [Hyalella azteca]
MASITSLIIHPSPRASASLPLSHNPRSLPHSAPLLHCLHHIIHHPSLTQDLCSMASITSHIIHPSPRTSASLPPSHLPSSIPHPEPLLHCLHHISHHPPRTQDLCSIASITSPIIHPSLRTSAPLPPSHLPSSIPHSGPLLHCFHLITHHPSLIQDLCSIASITSPIIHPSSMAGTPLNLLT